MAGSTPQWLICAALVAYAFPAIAAALEGRMHPVGETPAIPSSRLLVTITVQRFPGMPRSNGAAPATGLWLPCWLRKAYLTAGVGAGSVAACLRVSHRSPAGMRLLRFCNVPLL